jgi:hypothetical protein
MLEVYEANGCEDCRVTRVAGWGPRGQQCVATELIAGVGAERNTHTKALSNYCRACAGVAGT